MGNYRERLDIIADILMVVSNRPRKTQIMYQANLSYRILQRYLSELLDASLVSYETQNQHYALTEKGHQYLKAYLEYQKSNENLKKHIKKINHKKRVLSQMCPF